MEHHYRTHQSKMKKLIITESQLRTLSISLNENDSLLMVPGLGMRVDKQKHRLGMKDLEDYLLE